MKSNWKTIVLQPRILFVDLAVFYFSYFLCVFGMDTISSVEIQYVKSVIFFSAFLCKHVTII
jgi:hypothetical protein